jgi:hypothetical protein
MLTHWLFLVTAPRVTNESIKEATFGKKKKGDETKKKNSCPLCMWYDQGTTELATDGWIIIS